MKDLLKDDDLEESAVVANCRMNRERNLTGTNGYTKELGFHPLDFLREQGSSGRVVSWLDLCCGTGKALIEAARLVQASGWADQIKILGIDLVGRFFEPDSDLQCLRLLETSWRTWQSDGDYDLITCVHGLHYLGDKLEVITRSVASLSENGLFVANLDLANLKLDDESHSHRKFATALRRMGLSYDSRRRLVKCHGRKVLNLPFLYLGADDQAGPNYTGQNAVDSYYRPSTRLVEP